MFSHVFIGIDDLDASLAFYGPLLDSLGLERRFVDRERGWAGWHCVGGTRPFFVIAKPHDGRRHEAGNGQMVAFDAATREQVRDAYRIGLAHGGASEGEPGLRPQYHAEHYGAYLRDPDGNKVALACHAAP